MLQALHLIAAGDIGWPAAFAIVGIIVGFALIVKWAK